MTSETTQGGKGNAKRGIAIMLLGVLLPFLLGVDVLWPFHASQQTEWSRVIDERVHATAAATPGPKVLFVGGSNVIFGIKPRSLSERIGVPVVAYGVNAGVGLDLIAERAAVMVEQGDVVVLGPELQHFTPRGAVDRVMRGDWLALFGGDRADWRGRFPVRTWIAARGRCARIVNTIQAQLAQGIIDARRKWKGLAAPAPVPNVNEISSIDAQGYIAIPRPAPLGNVRWQAPRPRAAAYVWEGSDGARAVKRLAEVCREKGARLFVMPAVRTMGAPGENPDYLRMVVEREGEMIRFAEAQGAAALLPAGATVLGKEYVYNTTYHLNDKGVAVIEEKLAEALGPVVGSK